MLNVFKKFTINEFFHNDLDFVKRLCDETGFFYLLEGEGYG